MSSKSRNCYRNGERCDENAENRLCSGYFRYCIGVISWTIINVVTGKAKEKKISPLMYVLTVLFILKYICL